LVEDLGKDVTPEKFLDAIQKTRPDILAMSGLLTTSFAPMKKTVELIKKEYKEKLFIILGGSPVTEQWVKDIGADFGTNNAATGIKLINKVLLEAKV
jgi:methanogenic corrinoid protein MtbC1